MVVLLLFFSPFVKPVGAVIGPNPGTSFDTASQLGLTGSRSGSGQGIRLDIDETYYFWFLLEEKTDVEFKLNGGTWEPYGASPLNLYNSNREYITSGDFCGILSFDCIKLKYSNLEPGAYFLRVGGGNGIGGNMTLTWDYRGTNSSNALYWNLDSPLYGYLPGNQNEHWYWINPSDGQRVQFRLSASTNVDIHVYGKDTMEEIGSVDRHGFHYMVSFTTQGNGAYVKVGQGDASDFEYSLSALNRCYDFDTGADEGVVHWQYDPPEGWCGSEQNHAWYARDTELTVETTSLPGFYFDHWEGTFGDIPAEQHPYTFTFTNDTELYAIHKPCVNLSFTHNEGEFAGTQNPYAITPPDCNDGVGYVSGTTVEVEAPAVTGLTIAGWSGTDDDASTENTNTVTITEGDQEVGVIYAPACYPLTLSQNGPGGTIPVADLPQSPGCSPGHYHWGEVIVLTASPDYLWAVTGWDGASADEGDNSFAWFEMPPNPHAVAVTYEQLCFQMAFTRTGQGDSPTPDSTHSSACPINSYSYLEGTLLNLESHPAEGWHIARWEGTDNDTTQARGNVVTVPDHEHTVTAHYGEDALACYRLTFAQSGNGVALVAVPTNSAGCPAGTYVEGESIALRANPDPDWRVGGWVGTVEDSSTLTTNNLIMPAMPHSVRIIYELVDTPTPTTQSATPPTPASTSSTCVPATIALWAAERAPGGSGHRWQYVYRVSGATHVRFYDNVLPVDNDGRAVGTFAIWDDSYVPVGTLSAYNGSEECRVEETLPGFDPRNLPPAGTYSGRGFEDVDVSQRNIVISMRDYASIDGDRVRLEVNSAVVANDVTLTGSWHDVRVNLQPGANTVALIALNEGSESPNTVEIHISHVISGLPDQVSRGMATNQSDSFVIRAP
jgi:hypothetical protein